MATVDSAIRLESAHSAISQTNGVSEPIDLVGYKKIVLLTEGASREVAAKTAFGMLRYRGSDIAAVLDGAEIGLCAQEVFGFGGGIPMIASIRDCPDATALFIGISPAGGKLPASWKPILLEALGQGVDIVSGLHDFLINDPQLVEAARQGNARLCDVRRNSEHTVAQNACFPENNLRIHTVGQDCGVGKMVVSLEVQREVERRGWDARFLATGQTGIMIAGRGVPVDCVVADFISGAVEQLVLRNQNADTLVIEGQGSISHPSFSGVTLGLLHGCAPQGLILCYEAGRTHVRELEHVPLKPLPKLLTWYETIASMRSPAKVIGVAVNGKYLSATDTDKEVKRVEDELGLPACDVWRHGAGKLADAVEALRAELVAEPVA